VQWNNRVQCGIIYRNILICVTLVHCGYHDLSSQVHGPDGSVGVSCCLASDVKCMWLPMRISQMLVCKQQSHQNLE